MSNSVENSNDSPSGAENKSSPVNSPKSSESELRQRSVKSQTKPPESSKAHTTQTNLVTAVSSNSDNRDVILKLLFFMAVEAVVPIGNYLFIRYLSYSHPLVFLRTSP